MKQMSRSFSILVAALSLALPLSLPPSLPAADSPPNPALLLKQARTAYLKNDLPLALSLASQAITADPKSLSAYYTRGQLHEAARQFDSAAADYSKALELNPASADFYNLRGTAHFKGAKIKESIADFDQYLKLKPDQTPYHWQRGISYYYAKQFHDGRRQFESHQTVNENDVENAVWHFLCISPTDGLEKARAALLLIKPDPRIPMTQIYNLFAGKGSAEDVITAAEAGEPSPPELKQRLFYAHLYLALFYEASNNITKAREHMTKAAGPYLVPHYMGDVARVHMHLRGWNNP